MPNFGTPIDPNTAPPRPKLVPEPRVNAGTPLDIPVPQTQPAVLRTVALGYSTGAEAPQLPPGMSSRGSNFLSVMGGLTPRPGLMYSSVSVGSSTSTYMDTNPGWIGEVQDPSGNRYPIVLSSVRPVYYNGTAWSAMSQVRGSATTPVGYSLNTLAAAEAFFDAVQYYHPVSDSFELVFVQQGSASLPYTFRPLAAPTYSTLTNAPGANYVAAFDNRLVFANVITVPSGSSTVASTAGSPQRVAWSERGNPENYSAPFGGFEELLDAKGVITRLIADGNNRLLVFFNEEIWQGLKIDFPFTFQFIPLDKTVGTFNPWSVAQTPWGIMFLGNDLNVYVIPPGGTPQAVGQDAWRIIRENIATAAGTRDIANGVYDANTGRYLLTYRAKQGGELGMCFSLEQGRTIWDPIGFDIPDNWVIRRTGVTSVQSLQASVAPGRQRVLFVDGRSVTTTNPEVFRNALEFTSLATNDLGTAIDCRFLAAIPNPDPTMRQFVNEVRLDYRSTSASSMSLRLTPDFGVTYPVDTGVALTATPISAQSRIGVAMNAIYPAVELRHASGHTFTIQGLTAVVGSLGNG